MTAKDPKPLLAYEPNTHLFGRFSNSMQEQERRMTDYISWLESEISGIELSVVKMQGEIKRNLTEVRSKLTVYQCSGSPEGKSIPSWSELSDGYSDILAMLLNLEGLSEDPFHRDPMYDLRKSKEKIPVDVDGFMKLRL